MVEVGGGGQKGVEHTGNQLHFWILKFDISNHMYMSLQTVRAKRSHKLESEVILIAPVAYDVQAVSLSQYRKAASYITNAQELLL